MIAIDSNVILDVLQDGPSAQHSSNALRDALAAGAVVFNETTMAEICAKGESTVICKLLNDIGLHFQGTEERSAIRAGEMLKRYRQNGGRRERVLADFLIGAHALMQCDGLITYDGGFHRDYFKGLRVIIPGDPDASFPIH